MKRFAGLFILLLPIFARADVVVPIESVENHVNIRMSADSASEIVGRLNQGDYLPLVESIEEWHEVEIAGGATGFISADWTSVLDEPPVAAEEVESQSVIAATESSSSENAAADENESADEYLEEEVVEAPEVAVADDRDDMSDEEFVDDVSDAQGSGVATVEVEEPAMAEIATAGKLPDGEIVADDPAIADEDLVEINDEMLAEESAETETETETVIAVVEEVADEPIEEMDEAVVAAEEEAPVETEFAADIVVADTEELVDEQPDPAVTEAGPGQQSLPGLPGTQGPQGIPGPPGPAGAATIEGSVGFLTRFTEPTTGGTSQVFDDGNNIGIGTTEPKQRLEVNGNIQIHERNSSVAGLMITQSDGDTGYIMHNRASTLTIGAGSIDRITIDRDGNVGFGVSRPKTPIEMASGAHVTAGGVWTNSSSRARKENIAMLSLDDALTALTNLEPVRFNYKNDQVESYVGFIAEDVPDLVATSDRDGLSSMDIVAVLTRVVQEQQKKIEALEARLDQR